MTKRANESFAVALERQEAAKCARAAVPAPVQTPAIETREQEYHFWLVQRLNPARRASAWFGDKFELDYMGSSEFEFGAPHRSLERMRESGHFVLVPIELTRKGVTKTVYCLGPSRDMSYKIADFIEWAMAGYPRAKEFTRFDTLFDEDFGLIEHLYTSTVAWWSLDADFLWTLDQKVAEQLLYGLEHPATA